MTIRLSTGLRNDILNGGAGGGVRGAFAGGFIYIFPGTQPASPDTGATGTLLGKVTVNGDGSTGLNFDAAVNGVMSKALAEVWRFLGLADGQAGWFRFCEASDTPTVTSATASRMDGTLGTAGADMDISNTNVTTGAMNTVGDLTITMPGA